MAEDVGSKFNSLSGTETGDFTGSSYSERK